MINQFCTKKVNMQRKFSRNFCTNSIAVILSKTCQESCWSQDNIRLSWNQLS